MPKTKQSAEPKYPKVVVQLSGGDGNAFALMGKVSRALRQAGVPEEERNKFMQEAQSGDYDNLLRVCMKWVEVK